MLLIIITNPLPRPSTGTTYTHLLHESEFVSCCCHYRYIFIPSSASLILSTLHSTQRPSAPISVAQFTVILSGLLSQQHWISIQSFRPSSSLSCSSALSILLQGLGAANPIDVCGSVGRATS